MPTAPPHLCGTPGCYRLVPAGRPRCDQHQAEHLVELAARDERRGSSSSRGYDRRWRARRAAFLAEHPLCVDPYSLHPGRVTPATVVDHVVPHRGDRERFDDETNWQALCDQCHRVKTGRGQ